jgi:UPF0288 family protein (methanogenesis marker protein 3)
MNKIFNVTIYDETIPIEDIYIPFENVAYYTNTPDGALTIYLKYGGHEIVIHDDDRGSSDRERFIEEYEKYVNDK